MALRLLHFLPLLFLTACATTVIKQPVPGTQFHGSMFGGKQRVTGATVQLYAVGTTGNGSQATALLNRAATTDANGIFNITGTYTCPSADALVYIVGTGGNPGMVAGTDNPALALMAVLGAAENSQQIRSSF